MSEKNVQSLKNGSKAKIVHKANPKIELPGILKKIPGLDVYFEFIIDNSSSPNAFRVDEWDIIPLYQYPTKPGSLIRNKNTNRVFFLTHDIGWRSQYGSDEYKEKEFDEWGSENFETIYEHS